MRISDLSSDVCSSDLPPLDAPGVAVIGNGNVALDVARILAKTPAEFAGSDIVAHARAALATSGVRHLNILGRRGPHQIAMAPQELGDIGHPRPARPRLDPHDLQPGGARPPALEGSR